MRKYLILSLVGFMLGLAPALGDEAREEPALLESFDGLKMSARWMLPAGAVKGVAVILPGSGHKVGIDGDVSGPFLGYGYKGAPARLSDQVAAALARVGVASLRYAKRGAEDDLQLPNQTMPYLVKDAVAALEMARRRFPGVKTALAGFSEGALVSLGVAVERSVDALFLFGLPSRPIDDVIAYQFVEWPVQLLRSRLDRDQDGVLTAQELSGVTALPLLGIEWAALDANADGRLSVSSEVIPAYRRFYGAILELLRLPEWSSWFRSLQEFPAVASLASRIAAPVYVYHALDDAQASWAWVAADIRHFGGPAHLRLFPALGHCFAPMDGVFGEVKTSGPIDPGVLDALTRDVAEAL